MKRKGENLPTLIDSGGAPRRSGPFRVMQRPESRQETKVDGGGARARWSVARRKKKARRQKGESEKRTRGPIYKAGRISGMRGNRGDKKMDM